MNVSNPYLIYGIIIICLVLVVAVFAVGNQPKEPTEYDEFAKCLSEKGLKMYGSTYCGHCNDQKEMFGESWQYVDYVECTSALGGQTEQCLNAGIEAYPTWVLPDGDKVLGRQSFEELSEYSGCSLE